VQKEEKAMKNEKHHFYKVVAKCGHVGKKHYIPVQFAICAESGKEAARIVRGFPRVKHDHKDAILLVEKIDSEQFLAIKRISDNDPYLHCRSRREQRKLCDLKDMLVEDTHNLKNNFSKENRADMVAYKLRYYEIEYLNLGEEIYEYRDKFYQI
jgi:hypothetical protein